MRQYRIRGGERICGELAIGGAKNAALPILAAVCLNESETVIYNCPKISDIFDSLEILKSIGYRVEFIGNTLKVKPHGSIIHEIPDKYVRKMRSSILFMGALLARNGRVELALPGGCNLGERAINLHIKGLEALGAKIFQENDRLFCETDGLVGARINLDFPSVGATENLMIAAVKARGETLIENAAREPEVVDLSKFLRAIGAEIQGAGTGTILINGKRHLCKKAAHSIMPDRIVTGTYLAAAAMTAGEIYLSRVCQKDILPFTRYFTQMGCIVEVKESSVFLCAPKPLRAVPRIVTNVHPGFPTDMQAQFVAALSVASGRSAVTETIFEGRCSHIPELQSMGAAIQMTADKQTFIIEGVRRLRGATVTARDLRCGAALVLAALNAEGETTVQNAEYVERGYAGIEKDLEKLGADIRLETDETVEDFEKCA